MQGLKLRVSELEGSGPKGFLVFTVSPACVGAVAVLPRRPGWIFFAAFSHLKREKKMKKNTMRVRRWVIDVVVICMTLALCALCTDT